MSWRVICPNGHPQEVSDVDFDGPITCPLCSPEAVPPPPRPRHDLDHVRALVRRVASLPLAAADAMPDPSAPPNTPADSVAPLHEVPDIPGYGIIDEIGRGGMGVVYRARQHSLNRIVALKVIQSGPHAREAERARFRTEAAAAARLRHPNIVQIYEVGEAAGRPYLVLEHIEGGSLAQHLNGTPLDTRTAAELVATLADAMHAAHSLGIIHRDLKPGNILLQKSEIRNPKSEANPNHPSTKSKSLHSRVSNIRDSNFGFVSDFDIRVSDLIPKITDFGLAKQLDRDDGQTRTGSIIGTPSYMAPEQASGFGKNVGVAADVYALGAILYELLTGRPPFKAAGFLETLDQVRSQEALPPSKLQPGLPRDVQTICLKCLEKESRRRYDSAAELAEDLRRFLRGEPIAARPVSRWERLMKWSRRKPAAAALAGLSCLAVTAIVFGIVAHNARLRVEVERAARSEDEANKQSRRADANYREARDTLNGILNRFDDKRLLDVPRLKELRQDVLEKSLAFYQGVLKETDAADPAVRFDAAVALEQTGHIQAALSRPREAEENMRRAMDLFDQLAVERPKDEEVSSHLAGCLGQLAILCRMRAGPGVDAVKESLSPSEWATMDEAEGYLRRALQLRESLCAAQPDRPRWREELAGTQRDLAGICQSARKLDLAAEHARAALTIRSELFDADSTNPAYAAALAQAHVHVGRISAGREPMDQVESHYAEAAARLEPLVREAEQEPEYSVLLAQSYLAWGHLLCLHHERVDKAFELYGNAIRLMESLLEREPRDAQAKLTLHNAHGGRAYLHERLKRYPEALRDWDRVLELGEGANRVFNRSCRTVTLARSGAHAEAASEARKLVENPEGLDDVIFNACLVYSLAYQAALDDARLDPDSRRAAAEGYAAEALAALDQLRAGGYFQNPEYVFLLRTDPDLVFLRRRDDYQKLLHEVLEALPESDRQAVMSKVQP